jgi:flavin reductase (DIM6/NTAB) family NADH-FMN oxidoreductase RutF
MATEETVREVLGKLVHGVTIVGLQIPEGLPEGFTVSWLTQVSGDPPLIAIAVRKTRRFHMELRNAGAFSVSILGPEHVELAGRFGAGEGWAEAFQERQGKSPVIRKCVAWLDCSLVSILTPGGDHDLFVGQITEANLVKDGEPMVLNQTDGLDYTGLY